MAFNPVNIIEMQLIKCDLFKSQNSESGFFDVTFEIDGKIIYAHKTMLNLVSTTFGSMLSDRWNSNKDEPIKIKDYGYDDFYRFLTFLYSGQCELTDENIYSMVDIAEFYGVNVFKKYCDEYLAAEEITNDNIFKLLHLADKYSMQELKRSIRHFITNNFQSFSDFEGFLSADKSFIKELIVAFKNRIKPENLFPAIFKWSEKKAIDKQAVDLNLNLKDAVKAEISDFLPHICFDKMELHYLLEYVVPRGFIFGSLEELSKILCDRHLQAKVKVTNSRGQALQGILIPDRNIIKAIKSLKVSKSLLSIDGTCFFGIKSQQLPNPCRLLKKDGIEWYLTYEDCMLSGNGYINVKHSSMIHIRDYLLSEMAAEASGFIPTDDCEIEIL